MSAELHLPDLPEVPVVLGPEPGGSPRPKIGAAERLRQALLSYLPLLVLIGLVLGSWWLVRTAPKPAGSTEVVAPRHEPDYQLDSFEMQRWDASGRVRVRLEGRHLRHYPDTDELEIDSLRLQLSSPDGRLTEASARQAVVQGDASVARLEGDAQLRSQGPGGEPPLLVQGQRFVLRVPERQVSTDQPVTVRQGGSEFSASALDFDALKGQLQLHGQVRVTLRPPGARP